MINVNKENIQKSANSALRFCLPYLPTILRESYLNSLTLKATSAPKMKYLLKLTYKGLFFFF